MSRTGGAAGARGVVRIQGTRSIAAGAALFLAAAALLATNFMQPGFSESVVFTGLTNPTVVRFLPDGSVLVAEKSGLIKVFPNLTTDSPAVVADLSSRGPQLLGSRHCSGWRSIPNFATNHYVYVLYAYDAPIGGTPPVWERRLPDASRRDDRRLRRQRPPLATDRRSAPTGREQTPLINDWCQQFPSHSIGSLASAPTATST